MHDLGQALRALVRAPGVTLGISLLLGLGVAATTTLFAFVDAVLLRPLPYDQPDRLVMMWESNVTQDRLREGPSPGNVVDWVARNDAFDAITASMTVSATLRDRRRRHADRRGARDARFLRRVSPSSHGSGARSRADEYDGATSITSRQPSSGEPVIVLSHRLWQTLGADPQVVGRTIYVEGRDWRVIGVMPEDFAVPDATAAFWAPWDMRVSYRPALSERTPARRPVPARRRPDESRDVHRGRGGADADAGERIWRPSIPTPTPVGVFGSRPLADEIARTSRLELLLVFGAMFCLLLLVCANVASLAIARGVARAREIAIRLALGAGGQPRHATVDRRSAC